ncbi:enoyl-CoA hydratase-related protein [Shewanella dokdonensis]|uniref:Enoyl-CoA hydratase/isomerase family protein n=1 Tax=Shewanella dokdonensis TaxID=712036 RepID=A0ABX8DGD6_9GAMM|nr:enoyl-CoA hydratase-related protein [Shewanella dokdonensis]MCL1074011.1 enoyl-CoA hydratase-related protein [Shewanella dokdonensis]QVK23769.1 enoyl-CoA hydratase/isomerase family protein [Shewanella dokdonensis]
MQHTLLKRDAEGVCQLILNRPDAANAFDERLIAELITVLNQLADDSSCRLLLLRGQGKHFSAGADLHWMQRQAKMNAQANIADASELATLMRTLDRFPKPTVALVQGAAFGGALGLICCCDVAIATSNARFCLSEVRLGLLPAVISPYVHRSIGMRQLRRYALTAELIDASTALQLGLVHQVDDDLDNAAQRIVTALLQGGPAAQQQCKGLLAQLETAQSDEALTHLTVHTIANVRASEEAAEGISAFFAKRPPKWLPGNTAVTQESEHD